MWCWYILLSFLFFLCCIFDEYNLCSHCCWFKSVCTHVSQRILSWLKRKLSETSLAQTGSLTINQKLRSSTQITYNRTQSQKGSQKLLVGQKCVQLCSVADVPRRLLTSRPSWRTSLVWNWWHISCRQSLSQWSEEETNEMKHICNTSHINVSCIVIISFALISERYIWKHKHVTQVMW